MTLFDIRKLCRLQVFDLVRVRACMYACVCVHGCVYEQLNTIGFAMEHLGVLTHTKCTVFECAEMNLHFLILIYNLLIKCG